MYLLRRMCGEVGADVPPAIFREWQIGKCGFCPDTRQ